MISEYEKVRGLLQTAAVYYHIEKKNPSALLSNQMSVILSV